MALLRVLLEAEDGRTQTVIRARETLADAMGAHIDTVDRNMKVLVAAGAVEKLYSKGGQHKANCYRLKVIPHYLPQNAVVNGQCGDYLPQNADLPPAKYGLTSSKMQDPAYSSYLSGEKGRGLGAPDAAAHAASAPDAGVAADRQAIAQIMQAERCGYGRARDLLDARRRVHAGDLP